MCLSVRPLGLRQLKIPPASHLMCSCEIPFEYCSSELTVAKETETIPAQHPAWCHTGLARHTPASAVQVREPCELGLDLNHLLLEWPRLFHQHLLTCTPELSVSRMWVCSIIVIAY
uniref:Uncharacterized protein n=1 Tax=Piliocolobus tephrosceles TaxID=591936 RepID=A0A8C9H0P5_9PRIM